MTTILILIRCWRVSAFLSRYFCLPTEAHDNDGLPHTLEHLVFMGSEDYPYKEVGQYSLWVFLLFTLGLGAGPAGKQMSGFTNERLDSGGPHLLHRLHGWHLRLPPDPPHLPRPHTLPQPQEGRFCHRSAPYFRKGQVGHKFCQIQIIKSVEHICKTFTVVGSLRR